MTTIQTLWWREALTLALESLLSGEDLSGSILIAKEVKVWFSLRRSIIELVTRKPRKYVRAVDGISFSIKEQETFCLVGESGCGKTTTGKALLGLVPITGGTVLFRPKEEILKILASLGVNHNNGFVEISRLPPKVMRVLRREIQVVYQDPFGSLNPRYTIRAVLEEPLKIHFPSMSPEEREERVLKALEEVKLTPPEEFLERYPHQLSGGQRQRVAIARALILKPSLVVADEPVSMLDVSLRAEILELMQSLKKQVGLTYLFITHDLAVARYICDRIAVMYLGTIVEMGDARRIIEEPLHPYTQALIAAIPEPNPENRFRIRKLPIKGEIPSAADIPRGCRFHPRCVKFDENKDVLRNCVEKEPRYIIADGRVVACWLYEERVRS